MFVKHYLLNRFSYCWGNQGVGFLSAFIREFRQTY